METSRATDVLIIGAGLAGLAAARELVRAGFSVRILEKSNGVSGRAATKRLASGAIVDFGAPYFTVRSDAMHRLMQKLETNGIVKVWQYGLPNWNAGHIENSPDGYPRYIATHGMNTLGKALRDGFSNEEPLEIIQNALVSAVWHNNFGYRAVLENGDIHTARAVLVNAPAPQALALTRSTLEPSTYLALERVKFAPCWALMVSLASMPELPWSAMRLDHPVLSWASFEQSKRAMPATLVLHANAAWSTAQLESNASTIAEPMLAAAREVLGDWIEPQEILVHRWRYAQAIQPHAAPYLAQENLVFCGDWCAPNGNARIETAFESGWAAATHIVRQLEQPLEQILTGV